MHVVQRWHDAALIASLKLPAGHAAQVRPATPVPAALTYAPAGQSVYGTHALAGLRSWSHVPAGHADATPPVHASPAGHGSHAPPTLSVPSGHVPAGAHDAEFGAVLDVPAAHAAHGWSAFVVPLEPTYVPGAHTVHGAHDAESGELVNVPAADSEHARSLAAVPAALT